MAPAEVAKVAASAPAGAPSSAGSGPVAAAPTGAPSLTAPSVGDAAPRPGAKAKKEAAAKPATPKPANPKPAAKPKAAAAPASDDDEEAAAQALLKIADPFAPDSASLAAGLIQRSRPSVGFLSVPGAVSAPRAHRVRATHPRSRRLQVR